VLHKRDVAPGGRRQRAGVVIAVTGQADVVSWQKVPLLAGHFTRLAANAQSGVGEKTVTRH
jgi:hypothetical protein